MKAQEHCALGEAGTAGTRVNIGGDAHHERLELGFCDSVALSGDVFVADGFPVPVPDAALASVTPGEQWR